jgi:hypothetical protein
MKDEKSKAHGSNINEAWTNVHHLEPETNVPIPREDAVEDAKE